MCTFLLKYGRGCVMELWLTCNDGMENVGGEGGSI